MPDERYPPSLYSEQSGMSPSSGSISSSRSSASGGYSPGYESMSQHSSPDGVAPWSIHRSFSPPMSPDARSPHQLDWDPDQRSESADLGYFSRPSNKALTSSESRAPGFEPQPYSPTSFNLADITGRFPSSSSKRPSIAYRAYPYSGARAPTENTSNLAPDSELDVFPLDMSPRRPNSSVQLSGLSQLLLNASPLASTVNGLEYTSTHYGGGGHSSAWDSGRRYGEPITAASRADSGTESQIYASTSRPVDIPSSGLNSVSRASDSGTGKTAPIDVPALK